MHTKYIHGCAAPDSTDRHYNVQVTQSVFIEIGLKNVGDKQGPVTRYATGEFIQFDAVYNDAKLTLLRYTCTYYVNKWKPQHYIVSTY